MLDTKGRLPLGLPRPRGTNRRKTAAGVSMTCSGWRRIACVATREVCRSRWLLAAACAATLSACTTDGQPIAAAAQPRGASVAFESIDGPPPAQFEKLVQNLNDEAQARRLAVISRERPAAYHVRGYLAARVVKGETTISWIWDVFDADDNRALRISGEQEVKGRHADAWAVADDAMLQRIAHASMDQLAAFLTSPDVAPAVAEAPQPAAQPSSLALLGGHDFTPEAAGIFRIFHAQADPVPGDRADMPAAVDPASGQVPLPRRRPETTASMPADRTLAVAASSL